MLSWLVMIFGALLLLAFSAVMILIALEPVAGLLWLAIFVVVFLLFGVDR